MYDDSKIFEDVDCIRTIYKKSQILCDDRYKTYHNSKIFE